MHRSDSQKIRVTITLRKNTYKKIKEISEQMGLPPSTWISMISTSKANEINLKISI